MKKLTCSELGGPTECNHEVIAKTFEELGEHSKTHVIEMVMKGDEAHLAAIERMKNMAPEEQQAEFASFKTKFEEAPDA